MNLTAELAQWNKKAASRQLQVSEVRPAEERFYMYLSRSNSFCSTAYKSKITIAISGKL